MMEKVRMSTCAKCGTKTDAPLFHRLSHPFQAAQIPFCSPACLRAWTTPPQARPEGYNRWDAVVDDRLVMAAYSLRRAILAIQQADRVPDAEYDQALKLVVGLRERHLEATGRG